jgi:hypothetical protein
VKTKQSHPIVDKCFELAREIEIVAREKATEGDIYGVHPLVSKIQSVHMMGQQLERRYGL